MKTVCRVYDNNGQARAAVDALENAGVADSDISIIANKPVGADHADVDEVSGAAKGAGIGGIVGALVDAGINRELADVYSESIRRGGTMVTVRVRDEEAPRVEATMATYKPVDPVARGEEYRKTGWQIFDEKALPYRPNKAESDPGAHGEEYRKTGWHIFDEKAPP